MLLVLVNLMHAAPFGSFAEQTGKYTKQFVHSGKNLQATESRISDTDVATETTQFVRNQVLTQSAVAMLGQANSYPHMLAGLLNG